VGFADCRGSGVRQEDSDVSGPVMRAISEFRRRNPDRVRACILDAARLRRAAGHRTALSVVVPDTVVVEPNPVPRDGCVFFTVRVGPTSIRVLVHRDGAIVDGYDPVYHPDGAVDLDLLPAAHRAVLNFVLTHRQQAASWGLDCETLDLLWN